MTRKKLDEVRCKICKGTYPSDSDLVDAVWINRANEALHSQLLGYFCNECIPSSARLDGKEMVYVVDRMG